VSLPPKGKDQTKTYDISKREVWEAYRQVKANRGAGGVDGQSLALFDKDLGNNLYKMFLICGWIAIIRMPRSRGMPMMQSYIAGARLRPKSCSQRSPSASKHVDYNFIPSRPKILFRFGTQRQGPAVSQLRAGALGSQEVQTASR